MDCNDENGSLPIMSGKALNYGIEEQKTKGVHWQCSWEHNRRRGVEGLMD